MKLISKLFCLAALAGTFASCDKDYELPPLSEPSFTLPAHAKTITAAQLRETYQGINTQDTTYTFTEDLYLKGRVVSSDQSGNVYKEIVVQDATGGISIAVDQSNTYTDYPYGQEVVLNLKGMDVYFYGALKVGSPKGQLNRTPYEQLKASLHKNGWANPEKVFIENIDDLSKLTQPQYAFRIVRLKNVKFEEGGKNTFSAEVGSKPYEWNRKVLDTHNHALDIHTSPYAKFAKDVLPEGRGDIVGIVEPFKDQIQFVICNREDVYDFAPVQGGGEQGGGEQPAQGLLKVDFTQGMDPFTIDNISLGEGLSYVWKFFKHDTYGNCMKATAHVGGKDGHNVASDSRLVSPLIDLTQEKEASLVVEHCYNYFTNFDQEAGVEVRTEQGNWEKLTFDKKPSGSDYTYVVATASLAKYVGKKIQVAFHYTSTAASAGTWQIKQVEVKAAAGGGQGGGQVTPQEEAFYTQNFATSEKVQKKDGKFWPDFNDYVAKLLTPGKFATSERTTLRVAAGKNNIWFGPHAENWIEFQDIDVKGAAEVKISAQIAANLYNAGEENNLNGLEVVVGGKTYTFPSTPMKDKDQTIKTLSVTVPVGGPQLTFRIQSNKEVNQTGLRLFEVKVARP